MPKRFQPDLKNSLDLPAEGNWSEATHCFTQEMVYAIEAALFANRPLLIRGEPGTGKSQLARAAARHMKRLFLSHVVNVNTEAEDLQWHFDALGRLGNAQVGYIPDDTKSDADNRDLKKNFLNPNQYLSPGPLWWAFDYSSAEEQFNRTKFAKRPAPRRPVYEGKPWQPGQGCVLLIDEIDKAEPELPNGLLETLGNGAFSVPYCEQAEITMKDDSDHKPLVIFTTNEERQLPKAFLRRCLVLQLSFPEKEEELMNIGKAHFKGKSSLEVYQKVADLIFKERSKIHDQSSFKPGVAEYIDILRVLTQLYDDPNLQLDHVDNVQSFALKKSRQIS